MADKKLLTEKEILTKIKDLKIELLKNHTKGKSIKREIARLLTMEKNIKKTNKERKAKNLDNKNKLSEVKK